MKPLFKVKKTAPIYSNRKAQVLVEYLLLMIIAIGCATIITKQFISRDANDTGMIISVWDKIIKNIAKDVPDCVEPRCTP